MKTILNKLSLARSTRDPSRPRTRGGLFHSLTSFAVSAGLLVGGHIPAFAAAPVGPQIRITVDNDIQPSASTISFGTVATGGDTRSKTIHVANIGSEGSTLHSVTRAPKVTSAYFVGDTLGDFSVTPTSPTLAVASGASDSFTVAFTPNVGSKTARTAALHITTDSLATPDFVINVAGTAGTGAVIQVSGPDGNLQTNGKTAAIDSFGTVAQAADGTNDTTPSKVFTITNYGASTSTLHAVVTGTKSGAVFVTNGTETTDFQATLGTSNFSLAAGASTTLTVTFNPQKAAANKPRPVRSAQISITTDGTPNLFIIPVTGGVTAPLLPKLQVLNAAGNSTGSILFGNVVYAPPSNSETLTQTITLKNTSNLSSPAGDLIINPADITITRTAPTKLDFSADFLADTTASFEGSSPVTIAAGQSITLPVSATPQGWGPSATEKSRGALLNIRTKYVAGTTDVFSTTVLGLSDTPVPPAAFSLDAPIYTVKQNVPSVVVTVKRTAVNIQQTVTIKTIDGTDSASTDNPPYTGAIGATDFTQFNRDGSTHLDNGITVTFPQNVSSVAKVIPLAYKAGDRPNRRFNVAILNPDHNGTLATVHSAEVRIVAIDTAKPTLTVDTPSAAKTTIDGSTAVGTQVVSGTATDAKGISKVVVTVNGRPLNATLGSASGSPFAVPYTFSFTPQLGDNAVSVTAYDLVGNTSAAITRTVTVTGGVALNLTRAISASGHLTNSIITGDVTVVANNGAEAWKVKPTSNAPTTNPQIYSALSGASVRMTATAKTGYAFKNWTGLPIGATTVGNVTVFTMPSSLLAVSAVYVTSPFKGSTNTSDTFTGLISYNHRPGTVADKPDGVYTEGFLQGNISQSSGSFSGTFQIDGIQQKVLATFYGDNSCTFTDIHGVVSNSLIGDNGRETTLTYSAPDSILVTTTSSDGVVSTGTLFRGWYGSAARKVSSGLLNVGSGAGAKGFLTFKLPAVTSQPALTDPVLTYASTDFAQGTGYGTIGLNQSGGFSFVGTLADGTSFSCNSNLTDATSGPVFAQLTTLGGGGSKLGVLTGTIKFDTTATNSDVSSVLGLTWYRPANVGAINPAPPYANGWTHGIALDMVGSLFNASHTAQTTLAAGSSDATHGNSLLTFTGGQLVDVSNNPVTVTTGDAQNAGVNIVGNGVTYTRNTTVGISLGFTGVSDTTTLGALFNGNFSPTWTASTPYKGVVLQKGTNAGGEGFFLSNRQGESAPESGKVVLSKF